MAWSWSHCSDAYEYAENKLRHLKKGELNTIFSEWKWHFYEKRVEELEARAFKEDRDVDLPYKWEAVYNHWMKKCRKIPAEFLADQIWEWASEAATCDNGGWNAWMCPDGCHTVPFGP